MMYRHLAKEVMIKSFSGWTKDQQKNCLELFETVFFGSILFDVGELRQHLFLYKKI